MRTCKSRDSVYKGYIEQCTIQTFFAGSTHIPRSQHILRFQEFIICTFVYLQGYIIISKGSKKVVCQIQ